MKCRRWEEDDNICQWHRASPGETVTWLWWWLSSAWPGPGKWAMERGEGWDCELRTLECPELSGGPGYASQSSALCCTQASHVPPAPRYSQHTLTRGDQAPCTSSQSIPFLRVNYKLARGSFSRRGRVTFVVTLIVTPWGSIGSWHSDKWHDLGDLNIVIMTLPLTIVILSSTVYLGHLIDPDTER